MRKERISITLPKLCMEWLDQKVDERVYANREVLALLEKMKAEQK